MESMPSEGLRSAGGAWLVFLLLALAAGLASAQVPQDMTFSGRLVDGAGTPLPSPVTFDLWIYDTELAGNDLYAERHDPVFLDAHGNFSVLLGTGTDFGGPFPPFDAALFSEVERYVEVVLILPGFEVLMPRVPIASVPWALVAQQANVIVPDPNEPRWEGCGDGTVEDHQTGLQWEMKTGTIGSEISCKTAGCPDPHVVNNLYTWSAAGTDPDGGAFADFLAKLNDQAFGEAATTSDVTGCFAGHCDWRLPNIAELVTIRDCGFAPPTCIDPIFGPTASLVTPYWSASTQAGLPNFAWDASFDSAIDGDFGKTGDLHVRAVRAGSCR